MNWTEEDLKQHLAKRTTKCKSPFVIEEMPVKAKAIKLDLSDGKNKSEIAFEQHLEMQKRSGLIDGYGFECMTFVLADGSRFTPDFFIIHASGSVELVDVKAFFKNQQKVHVEEAAMVRVKVAAELYPWFIWTQTWKDETGEWRSRQFLPRGAK